MLSLIHEWKDVKNHFLYNSYGILRYTGILHNKTLLCIKPQLMLINHWTHLLFSYLFHC